MRMDHDFAAADIAARHCAELISRGPRPEEREAQITAWRRDLARHLAASIGALFSGDQITAQVGSPEWLTGSDVLARIGPVAANSLLRCGTAGIGGAGIGDSGATSVLLSLDHATALALAERSFGGEGRVGEASLDPLPRSALLMSDEVATRIAEALGAARLGDGAQNVSADLRGEVILRSENAARLRAFDPAGPAALIMLTLASGQGCEWRALLALGAEGFECLLPEVCADAARALPTGPAGADGASFGAIPLGVRAVLAEIELTLTALDRLAPGDMLPLAMPRSVPLQIGDALVGHGTIGTLEDRMALRLTQLGAPSLAPSSASSLQQGFSQ